MPVAISSHPAFPARAGAAVAAALLTLAAVLPVLPALAAGPPVDHLVVSEVVTGGASASDELIELHNPTAAALPLEGLEVIYVTASGATITRRAAWALGAPSVAAGGHVLIANEAGVYASIADALYASGMAATGGSVAIRILGASTAIDAVGWGTATSTWREGATTAAPAPATSIERLPGGQLGSGQDTDDNAADFVIRTIPEPQNLSSPPTPNGDASPTPSPTPDPTHPPGDEPTPQPTAEPTASATPTATPTPIPTSTPAPSASASPGPGAVSIATARSSTDGATVTIEGVALTASDFHDGGGYIVDESAGIAVLVDGGGFVRGDRLRVTGTVDDRFSQRTIRAAASGVTVIGAGADPQPRDAATGSIGEPDEGQLVHVSGALTSGASALTTGTAFDLDDGSGVVRVVVGNASGISLSGWTSGAHVELDGVVGQRDSTGSGSEGYRVMPRDPGDVLVVGPSPTASPTPSPPTTATPSPSTTPAPTASDQPAGITALADARAAAKNARLRVRGVVTLPTGVVDDQTAAIQDASGAIILRLSDEVGALGLGDRIEVAGTRSTKSGMETLRVTEAPLDLDSGTQPQPLAVKTGEAGEAAEAMLVRVRGAIAGTPHRASSGSLSFEIDDGSGPLRIAVGGPLGLETEGLVAGAWIEVTGVLGQETTGAQPLRGYRVWPRSSADVRVVASATTTSGPDEVGSPGASTPGALTNLAEIGMPGGPDPSELRIGATIVVGPWPELGVGGILWDGTKLVAVSSESSAVVASLLGARRPPVPAELAGLSAAGSDATTGAPLVTFGTEPGSNLIVAGPPAPPRSGVQGSSLPVWASVVGTLVRGGHALNVGAETIALERRCSTRLEDRTGTVGVVGIAVAHPARLIVPCDGIVVAASVGGTGVSSTAARAGLQDAPSAGLATSDDSRRGVAAGLLVAAALTLAGAAAWSRRRASEPTPTTTRAVDEPQEEAADAGGARLTLVPMPGEHSSRA